MGAQNHSFGKIQDSGNWDKIALAGAEWHANDDQKSESKSELEFQYGNYVTETTLHRMYF